MNENELNYCRSTDWKAAGYTGKGIKVAVREVLTQKINPIRYPKAIIPPMSSHRIDYDASENHLHDVLDSLMLTAPDVEVHILGGSTAEDLQYLIDNGIHIMNMSTNSYWYNPTDNPIEQKYADGGGILMCCAGNDGAGGLWQSATKENFISVGAVAWKTWQGVSGPYITNYSSYNQTGTHLDFVSFGDLYLTDGPEAGTSFSTPFAAGLIAQYLQKFIKVNSRVPAKAELFDFIKVNCTKLVQSEYDQRTGYGVFRLPEVTPEPAPEPEYDVLEITNGSKTAKLNGQPHTLGTTPTVINGSLMVGMRDAVQAFGGNVVSWSNATQTAVLKMPRNK